MVDREHSLVVSELEILSSSRLSSAALQWLMENGCSVDRMVDEALSRLRERHRYLSPEKRVLYVEKIVLAHFFVNWLNKHQGDRTSDLIEDDEIRLREFDPFQLALMAIGNEAAFHKIVPRMARKRMVERTGLCLGSADEFTAFVAETAPVLCDRFLKNFDASRKGAAGKVIRYLQVAAVSFYLVKRTRPIREDVPNLQEYLARSKRMDQRTVLAVKLAYLPAILSFEERAVLRDQYRMGSNFNRRLKIKDIAELLGYPSAATLSRKLYRVREWCRKSSTASRDQS